MTVESDASGAAGRRAAELVRLCVIGAAGAGKTTLVDGLLRATQDHADPRPGGSAAASAAAGAPFESEPDIAARSFATSQRRFLVVESPGDDEHTHRVLAATARAELAIVVIDARVGIGTQARRSAFIASLMGVPRVVVAINKMDLVGYDRATFERIRAECGAFAARLHFAELTFVALSALAGDNVVTPSAKMPWYAGSPLLPHLESVYIAGDVNLVDFRFPVHDVVDLAQGARACAGVVASGVVRRGDQVVVVPSGQRTRVTRVVADRGDLDEGVPPLPVTLHLADDVDVRRGEMLAHPANVPSIERAVEAMVVWLGPAPLAEGDVHLVEHTTRTVRASCAHLAYRVNPDTLRREAARTLGASEVGRVRLTLFDPLFVDAHRRNRVTGTLVIRDVVTRAILGAAVVIDRRASPEVAEERADAIASRNVFRQRSRVDAAERATLLRQRPLTVWLTGLSGSGKSTLAHTLERRLVDAGHACFVLDGDNLRHGLNRNLGFTPEDRRENVRRTAETARLMNDAGLIVITALISPYAEDRAMAQRVIGAQHFFETYLAADVAACEGRDPKGLYAKARRGEIAEFTGVNAPYEAPTAPAIELATDTLSVEACVELLYTAVRRRVTLA